MSVETKRPLVSCATRPFSVALWLNAVEAGDGTPDEISPTR